ncbi:MAG TPA: peptidase M61 [Usitatibacter sp.]|nr:peptidase M61 [Usitatibacter sp.]
MNPARLAAAALAAVCVSSFAQGSGTPPRDAWPGVISLEVDAVDLEHRVMHVRETIPSPPGRLRLVYPQWIPGHHGPTASAASIAGIVFRANGRELDWRRDPADVFAFEVDVPQGAAAIEASFDFLSPLPGAQGRVVMTEDLVSIDWEDLVLYPAGVRTDGIRVRPSAKIAAQWQAASSLGPGTRSGDTISHEPVSLTRLVDSPLWAGRYLKRYEMPGLPGPAVAMDVFGDLPGRVEARPAEVGAIRDMVGQAYKALGAPYFGHYDFLLAMSKEFSPIALEHLSSTEIRLDPEFFTRWKSFAASRYVITHEFVHSWIGKKHRPADLATANYNMPMGDTLLWVYEGETDFWAYVLTGRSGLLEPGEERDAIARAAAYVDGRTGRSWRNLQDTTNDPVISASGRGRSWAGWQRGFDYYAESVFLWMEVDARLRTLTNGARSMDDFAHAFHGSLEAPGIVAYTERDVVEALEALAPGNWRAWLRERLESKTRMPAAEALRAAGWRVAYSETAGEYFDDIDSANEGADFSYSIGLAVGREDAITYVQWNGPAFRAGLATGGKLLAVNGHAYKKNLLKDAITAAKASGKPVALLVKEGDTYRTVDVAYGGGLRYPHLERIEGAPDLLSKLLEAR